MRRSERTTAVVFVTTVLVMTGLSVGLTSLGVVTLWDAFVQEMRAPNAPHVEAERE
jgi:hypothetical protein